MLEFRSPPTYGRRRRRRGALSYCYTAAARPGILGVPLARC
ncbi:hypothetical protein [Catelliglobosispora koreensis]|nr:hypothetical protein [Catelliglobosispora koreensis]